MIFEIDPHEEEAKDRDESSDEAMQQRRNQAPRGLRLSQEDSEGSSGSDMRSYASDDFDFMDRNYFNNGVTNALVRAPPTPRVVAINPTLATPSASTYAVING